jgi:hypothetical protein
MALAMPMVDSPAAIRLAILISVGVSASQPNAARCLRGPSRRA